MRNNDAEAFGYRVLMRVLFGPTDGPPAWRERAACAGSDPSLFDTAGRIAAAKKVCASCPVIDECRQDQLDWEATSPRFRANASGVVGGLTGADRRRIHHLARNAKDVA
ncbi:WhiB family transcriptional regulator [Lentzea sp. HUAS12]|uniref:WhiB family transcriptional regulator n=1 Tax=Lentzea sp. HUAS12 TaxID=2951806 RepID=UPI0020A1A5A4|nr:WhiB family transcriptional regulator [Lentzea sp. HUAS12]USX50599.1 WhiB family transcriptional regulator [Lentzea sp. HUAS12]